MLNFIFLYVDLQVFQCHLFKGMTFFFGLSMSKLRRSVFFGESLFLGPLFCSFTCVFNFSPEPHIVSLKIGNGGFPSFVFL
jgi:hypothetical protein